jgi:P-type conjugative transfer protein TrbJ
MAENTDVILAAIGALDEKFDRKFDELKKVDGALTEEVQRISRKQDRMEQDLRDHKSDSIRARDADKHEAAATMQAIVEHVDKSAEAFQAKAAAIDALTAMQVKQTAILERLDKVAANPMVRRVAYLIGLAIAGWLASKGIK